MKVIQMVGVPEASAPRMKGSYPIAIVYFTRWFNQLRVEPIGNVPVTFTKEVERIILERIAENANNPNGAFAYHVGTEEHPHARKFVKVGDPDILRGIAGDEMLWRGATDFAIAGYEVWPGGFKIIDK